MSPSITKGESTRRTILERAVRVASTDGLEGLTVGTLATELGMSKSGLFAHFQSKEALQVSVLEAAVGQFVDAVLRPALAAPRGEARLRAVFDGWMAWAQTMPGGCIFTVASVEFDDQPGAVRDRIVTIQRDWIDFLATCIRTGQQSKAFRKDADPDAMAWELYGMMLAHHMATRLLQDPKARTRTRSAFDRLVTNLRPSAS